MRVTILRYPTDEDWARCHDLALMTMGREPTGEVPSVGWRQAAMFTRYHSMHRTIWYTIRMEGIPYYVSTHFVRHKIGVEHYVSSQRNDRQSRYDRAEAPQGAPVTHTMDINAPSLINLAGVRLCGTVWPATREWMREVCRAVAEVTPEMAPFLRPKCALLDRYDGYRRYGCYCTEFRPCHSPETMQWEVGECRQS